MKAIAWPAVGVLLSGVVPAAAGGRTYVLDPAASSVSVHLGRAGLFKFAGHEHEILAPRFQGQVVADSEDIARSSVELTFDAGALRVSERDEPPADVPKVQARMVGPDVLDVARFPSLSFRSKSVAGKPAGPGEYEVTLTGEITLHGVTRSLSLRLRVALSGDTLTASGKATLRHTDFGITPVSVAGVVKVKNEIAVDYKIVAKAAP